MKYCQKCGAFLPDDAQFCADCGNSVSGSFSQPTTYQPQPVRTQPVPSQQPYPQQYSSSPQAWLQCRSCNAMIPYSPQTPVYNCPVCGRPLSGRAEKSFWSVGRILMLLSIFLTLAGTFLPFFSYSVLGMEYNIHLWSEKFMSSAIIIAGILFISLVVTIGSNKTKGVGATIGALLILADIFLNYTSNQERLTNLDTGLGVMDLSGLLSPGPGFYLMVIGCVGMIISCIVMFASSSK